MLKVVPVPVSWRQNEEKKRWLNFYVCSVPDSWRQNEEIKWLNVKGRPRASLVEAERRKKKDD